LRRHLNDGLSSIWQTVIDQTISDDLGWEHKLGPVVNSQNIW